MGRLMGIDYGDSRVGISVSDPLQMTAQGVKTLKNFGSPKLFEELKSLLAEYMPEKLVIGMPKNMNDTAGDRVEKTYDFIEKVKNIYSGEIVLWDERLTTVSAIRILNATNTRGNKRKQVIDTVAASLILENYMQAQKNKSEQ